MDKSTKSEIYKARQDVIKRAQSTAIAGANYRRELRKNGLSPVIALRIAYKKDNIIALHSINISYFKNQLFFSLRGRPYLSIGWKERVLFLEQV